jgi:hypothetical protein
MYGRCFTIERMNESLPGITGLRPGSVIISIPISA